MEEFVCSRREFCRFVALVAAGTISTACGATATTQPQPSIETTTTGPENPF